MSNACDIGTWLSGNWHTCVFGKPTEALGEPLIGLFFGGVTILGMYIASGGDMDSAAVLTILLGAVMVPVLPGGLTGAAYAIALIGAAAAVVSVAQKYILNPGAEP
jgi:hypothetical protein